MTTNPNDTVQPQIKSDKEEFGLGDGRGSMPVALTYSEGGLTKREYFAAMFMQGLLSNPVVIEKLAKKGNSDGDIAFAERVAIEYADALIAELNKESK